MCPVVLSIPRRRPPAWASLTFPPPRRRCPQPPPCRPCPCPDCWCSSSSPFCARAAGNLKVAVKLSAGRTLCVRNGSSQLLSGPRETVPALYLPIFNRTGAVMILLSGLSMRCSNVEVRGSLTVCHGDQTRYQSLSRNLMLPIWVLYEKRDAIAHCWFKVELPG